MSGIRLLSAFLFALSIVVFLLFGGWFLNLKRVEQSVLTTLEEKTGATVSYDEISQEFKGFSDIVFHLKNLKLHYTFGPDEELVLQSQSAGILTDPTGQTKFHIELPNEIQLTSKWNNITQTHNINIEEGDLVFYPSNDMEMVLNAKNILLGNTQRKSADFKASYIYFNRKGNGKAWELILKEPVSSQAFLWPIKLGSLKMEWGTPVEYDTNVLRLMTIALSGQKEELQKALLQEIRQYQNLGVGLDIATLRIEKEREVWGFNGELKANTEQFLSGKFKMTTNTLLPWLDDLQRNRWLSPVPISFMRILERLIRESHSDMVNVDLALRDGHMLINGYDLGSIQNIPAILGAEGKR